MGRSTIKIDDEAFDRHNERRKQPGMTWEEYIDGQAPEDLEEMLRRVIREELGDGGGEDGN